MTDGMKDRMTVEEVTREMRRYAARLMEAAAAADGRTSWGCGTVGALIHSYAERVDAARERERRARGKAEEGGAE